MDSGPKRTFYLGRYNCVERLGEGPLGETWRAKVYGVAGFEKQFAVKRLQPELCQDEAFVTALVKAANAYAALDHERIARVDEVNVQGSQYYVASDLIRGTDLQKLIEALAQRGEALATDAAMLIALEVADALGYAHARRDLLPNGVLHLALTPRAIHVTHEGDVRIDDVGLLAPLVKPGWTEAPSMATTAPYVAPELHRAENADARADVYSLGVVLYELLSARRPFAGTNASETLRQMDAGPPPSPPTDARLQSLLGQMLQATPEFRLPSMAAAREQLVPILASRANRARSDLAALVRRIARPERKTGSFPVVAMPSLPPPVPTASSPRWAPPATATAPGRRELPPASAPPHFNTLAGIGPDEAALMPVELVELPGTPTIPQMDAVAGDEATTALGGSSSSVSFGDASSAAPGSAEKSAAPGRAEKSAAPGRDGNTAALGGTQTAADVSAVKTLVDAPAIAAPGASKAPSMQKDLSSEAAAWVEALTAGVAAVAEGRDDDVASTAPVSDAKPTSATRSASAALALGGEPVARTASGTWPVPADPKRFPSLVAEDEKLARETDAPSSSANESSERRSPAGELADRPSPAPSPESLRVTPTELAARADAARTSSSPATSLDGTPGGTISLDGTNGRGARPASASVPPPIPTPPTSPPAAAANASHGAGQPPAPSGSSATSLPRPTAPARPSGAHSTATNGAPKTSSLPRTVELPALPTARSWLIVSGVVLGVATLVVAGLYFAYLHSGGTTIETSDAPVSAQSPAAPTGASARSATTGSTGPATATSGAAGSTAPTASATAAAPTPTATGAAPTASVTATAPTASATATTPAAAATGASASTSKVAAAESPTKTNSAGASPSAANANEPTSATSSGEHASATTTSPATTSSTAAAPNASAPGEGNVEINTAPAGAMLYVDGEERGLTPQRLTLAPGSHRIVATLDGYRMRRESTRVSTGITQVNLTLIPARLPNEIAGPAGLKLRCAKTHGELRILIDGEDSGRSCPNEERISVKEGPHRIGLYSPRTDQTVEVEKDVPDIGDHSTRIYLKY